MQEHNLLQFLVDIWIIVKHALNQLKNVQFASNLFKQDKKFFNDINNLISCYEMVCFKILNYIKIYKIIYKFIYRLIYIISIILYQILHCYRHR